MLNYTQHDYTPYARVDETHNSISSAHTSEDVAHDHKPNLEKKKKVRNTPVATPMYMTCDVNFDTHKADNWYVIKTCITRPHGLHVGSPTLVALNIKTFSL